MKKVSKTRQMNKFLVSETKNARKGKFKTNPATKFRIDGKQSQTVKKWSGYVTKHSFALALEEGVFTWDDPKKIATSLKRSVEESLRRKTTPFQSAMSMLNFYINRAGKNLKPARKRILEQAKIELRKLFPRSSRKLCS